MLDVIRQANASVAQGPAQPSAHTDDNITSARTPRILLVDHEDSFVHTLANYFRQSGAEVVTLRAPISERTLTEHQPDLVVLSPGPGRPTDYGVPELVALCARTRTPAFGVCLGLQGMVEAFGGALGVLPEPVHGKASVVCHYGHPLFAGIPSEFLAGRYHSLFARPECFPESLAILARSEDGVIMAVEHPQLPLMAVQFHPESILTKDGGHGLQLIRNVLQLLCSSK